jgi:DNA polymerase-1
MAERVLLIDGSSYFYSAFYARGNNAGGAPEPNAALIQTWRRIDDLIRAKRPSRYCVVFDVPGPTFREDIYPEYKAGREEKPREALDQLARLEALYQAAGTPVLCVPGVEADDVLGTLARNAADEGHAVLIATNDKDMAQLVDGRIALWQHKKSLRLDAEGVFATYGVRPEQMVDFLALVGDASDGVPGVEKCGPKTAARWLAEYGTLDALIESAEEIGGKVGDNLRRHLPFLPTARALIAIKCDCSLGVATEHLVPSDPLVAQVSQLCSEHGLDALTRSILSGMPSRMSRAEIPEP